MKWRRDNNSWSKKVLRMVDVQTISIAVASASVVAGVVYYALQLRHQNRVRQTDTLMRLYSAWGSEDLQKAAWTVLELKFEDYDDYVKKYTTSGTPTNIGIFRVAWFFNGIGVLLQSKLADIKLVDKLFGYMVIWLWKIMKPIVEGERKSYDQPKSLEWFEYLYNEMQRFQQSKKG
jgi:hypothetical protein